MAMSGLMRPSLKLILFGGKGGVGKTTCASAASLYMAERGMSTLLISTDPAHSLSDSLGREIGDEIREISGVERLSAIEINADKALSDFKKQYDSELRKLFDTSTYLDREDIDAILGLPIPGIDEVMGFKKIMDLMDEGRFDKYVVDTAPTGHALRLLTFPRLLDDWIKVLSKLRWKYRYVVKSLTGKYMPDNADDLLINLKKTVKRIDSLLRDKERCEFIVVTIPEDMAVKETERLIKSLIQYGISVRQLIINHIINISRDCPVCQVRMGWQERYIKALKDKFNDLKIILLPLQPDEVKGIDVLRNLCDAWCEG